MNPRRAISKLAPKAQSFEQGMGGEPECTQSEAAAACGNLTYEQYDVVTMKWAGNAKVLPRLAHRVHWNVLDLAAKGDWKVPRGSDLTWRMTLLAIYEVTQPNRCKRCKGVGWMAHRSCPRCHGTGDRNLRDSDRAEMLGMSRQNFGQNWSRRYEMIYQRVADYEHVGLREIAAKLRDPDNERSTNDAVAMSSGG